MKKSITILDGLKKTCIDHCFETETEEQEFIREILGVCIDYNVINAESMSRIMSSFGYKHTEEDKPQKTIDLPEGIIKNPDVMLYDRLSNIIRQQGKSYIRVSDLIDLYRNEYSEIVIRDKVLGAVKGIRRGEFILDDAYDCIKHRDYTGECTETKRKDRSWFPYLNKTR